LLRKALQTTNRARMPAACNRWHESNKPLNGNNPFRLVSRPFNHCPVGLAWLVSSGPLMFIAEGTFRRILCRGYPVKLRNPPTILVDGGHSLAAESAIEITKSWAIVLDDFLHVPIEVSRTLSSLWLGQSLHPHRALRRMPISEGRTAITRLISWLLLPV
jgi:hypothetical protein